MSLEKFPTSLIYFVRSGDDGPIKIGHTSTGVGRRVSTLQTGNPLKMTLLAVEPGTRTRERELHDMFADAEMPGEWFKPTKALLMYIAALPPIPEDDLAIINGSPRRLAKRMTPSEARDVWRDNKLTTTQALSVMWGWNWQSANRLFGDRHPPMTAKEKQAEASKQRRKNYLAERMPIAEARKIWHNNSDWTNEQCLAEMPGWTLRQAYRELKKRKLAKGRPRKATH